MVQYSGVLARASPSNVIRCLSLWKVRHLGRFLAVVEDLIQQDFHGSRQLFERLDGWDGVSVFDTGNVAAQQSRSLFDVALRKILCFPQAS